MAAVPASFAPMPLTLVLLPSSIFFFGLEQTVPIIIATTVSYALFTASGLFRSMTQLRKKREEAEAAAKGERDPEADGEDEDEEEDVIIQNGRPVFDTVRSPLPQTKAE